MDNPTVPNPVPEPVLTSNQVEVVETKPKSNKLLTGSLLLLSLLLLLSTAFLYYQNMQLKNMLASYQPQSVVSPTLVTYQSPAPSATTDPTANWKTYADSKFGFSFKYPSNWSYKVGETNSVNGGVGFDTMLPSGNKNTNYIFGINLEAQSDFDTWSKYNSTVKLENQTINGLVFEKYITADMYYSLNYIVKNNGKLYRISLYPYDKDQYPGSLKSYIDQILSTFKFSN